MNLSSNIRKLVEIEFLWTPVPIYQDGKPIIFMISTDGEEAMRRDTAEIYKIYKGRHMDEILDRQRNERMT